MFLRNFLKKNALLITILIIISTIFGSTHIVGLLNVGSSYSALTNNGELHYSREETYAYASQVNQMLRGNFNGDAYIWEYKNKPSPFLGEVLSILPLTFLSKVLGSTTKAFLVADFLFPPMLVLLLYLFLRTLNFSKIISIFFASAVIILPFFSTILPYIITNDTLATGARNYPLFFTRTPHPQISSIILLVTMLSFVFFIKKRKNIYFFLWTGSVALSIYTSIYVASTVVVGTVLLLPFIIKKIALKQFVLGVGLFLSITFPFIFNYFQQQFVLGNVDFIQRATFDPHMLFPSQLRYLAIAVALLVFYRKNQFVKILFTYITAAVIMTDEHQLLFGRDIEGDHWISRILAPLSTLALLLIGHELMRTWKKININIVGLIGLIGVILSGLFVQLEWINSHKNSFALNSDTKHILEIVNSESQPQDVIATNNTEANDIISGIAGRWVFIGPGDRTLASTQEQIERLCIFYQESGINPSDNIIRKDVNYIAGYISLKKEKIDSYIDNVKKCLRIKEIGKKYKIDYMLIYKNNNWVLQKL